MSFDTRIWGNYGDEKVSGSTKLHDLGQRMELPDGRVYAYGRIVAASAGVAGKLYQGNNLAFATDGVLAGTGLAVATNAAIGDRTIAVTLSATTAMTATLFEDGYLNVDNNTGEGHVYKVQKCSTAAAGSTSTVTLAGNDKVKVALAAGTTTVGFKANEFYDLTLTTASTVGVGAIAGVLPVAASVSHYAWVQRRGVCSCIVANTVIVGEPVVAGTNVAGSFQTIPVPAATTEARVVKELNVLGYCLTAAASLDYGLFNLCLE